MVRGSNEQVDQSCCIWACPYSFRVMKRKLLNNLLLGELFHKYFVKSLYCGSLILYTIRECCVFTKSYRFQNAS